MRIAILTTDSREHFKQYERTSPYFGTAPEALLQGFEGLPGAEVHVISCARARMKSPEKLAPNVFFHSIYVPKIGWTQTLFQGCVRATRKLLQRIKPNIVHGQGTERDCAISAVFSGFPNVLTIHGNMRLIAEVNRVKPFSYWWLAARLERFTVPRSHGVVCITHYTQQAVASLARRTWVVPNAVDASFFEIKAQPSAEKPPSILCVGDISMRKNQIAFIRALDPLAQKRGFKVVFLGPADPKREYDAEFLGLVRSRPWCVHTGPVDRAKLKLHLRDSSLLALPSLEDNCPMVVLEAHAAEVPVVAARVGGVPDLIEEDKTGVFCDPLSDISMREAIERLLSNPALARDLAATARREAQQRFHPKVVARRHIEIYTQLLQELRMPV